MSYGEKFYLVRHGSYDSSDGSLDAIGREQALIAQRLLVNRGLGVSAVLLSSDARRAAETAEIIGEGLGVEPVLSSLINGAGNNAWSVSDLDAVVAEALLEAGLTIDSTSQDLVVVTHAPMLAVARGVMSRDVRFGEVYSYTRNSWNNPDSPR